MKIFIILMLAFPMLSFVTSDIDNVKLDMVIFVKVIFIILYLVAIMFVVKL